jgi:hypothetical protein
MTSKPKAFGLILAVAMVLSAASASAAQGFALTTWNSSTLKMEAGTYEGEQINGALKFTAGAGFEAVTCSTGTFSGKSSGEDEKPELTATYTKCKQGKLAAVRRMNGCTYRLHISEALEAGKYKGTGDIVCPGAAEVEVEIKTSEFEKDEEGIEGATKCLVKVPPQLGFGPIYFENDAEASPNDIRVVTEAKNVEDKTTPGKPGCGLSEGLHTDGAWTGTITLKAKNAGGTLINLTTM